jgi:hypothetical protein
MNRSIPAVVMLALLSIGHTAAEEACEPLTPPPSRTAPVDAGQGTAVAPASPAADLEFGEWEGGEGGPELVFLGDSLTAGNAARYPWTLSELQDDRAFRAYATGGAPSGPLVELFEEVEIGADAVGLIWIGRNNPVEDADALIADLRAVAARFVSGNYLVLSFLSGRFESEQPTEPRREAIDRLNEEIAASFPDRFVDVRPALACADFDDNIHLTDEGYDKVAALVSAALDARGW